MTSYNAVLLQDKVAIPYSITPLFISQTPTHHGYLIVLCLYNNGG